MRGSVLIGGAILAAAAAIVGWQQVQLTQLKHQGAAAAEQTKRLTERMTAMSEQLEVAKHDLASAYRQLDDLTPQARELVRLRSLLAERARTVADAREVAATLHIAPDSPEMQAALELATRDVDAQISAVGGADSSGGLALTASAPAPLPSPAPAQATPAVVVLSESAAESDSTTLVAPAAAGPDASVGESEAALVETPILGWASIGFLPPHVREGRRAYAVSSSELGPVASPHPFVGLPASTEHRRRF